MKKTFIIIAAIVAAAISLPSCSMKDDYKVDGQLVNAVVTVKNEGGKCALQVQDDIRVYPTNAKEGLFGGREVRALTQFTTKSKEPIVNGQEVELLWIDSILTKKALVAEDGIEYGKDAVDIYNDWLTVAEDGYVTLHIRTYMGYGNVSHIVNLIGGVNPENPYEFEFCHDAKGDLDGRVNDAVVAFNVRDFLPETAGDVELTIRFKSFSGPKSFTLKTKVQ